MNFLSLLLITEISPLLALLVISFCHSMMMIWPGALEKLEAFMNERPDLDAAIGEAFLMEEGKVGPWVRYGRNLEDYYPLDQDIPPGKIWQVKEDLGSHLLPSGPKLYRREEIIRLGGWPGLRGSDDSLLLHRANQEKAIGHPKIPYFVYRLYEGNISKNEQILELRKRNDTYSSWQVRCCFKGKRSLPLTNRIFQEVLGRKVRVCVLGYCLLRGERI